jgi:hypothetical protein
LLVGLVGAGGLTARGAEAQQAAVAATDVATQAREEFRAGSRLVEASEWAAAVQAFERSLALRPHALTIYNMGVCQRFLGRYTLASTTLRAAIARGEATSELPELFREQARAYLDEIERKLARVTLTVNEPKATVAIDGRPLAELRPGELIAGIAPPGEGKTIPASRFVVVLDPGRRVMTFQLEGHDTVEIPRDFKPGATEDQAVSMTEQEAHLQIDATRPQCVVRIDDVDVGLTPASVTRPPGQHTIKVSKDGFVTYRASVVLRPGQRTRLVGDLPVERVPLTKRWWFWTAATAVVATGAAVTYAVTRPTPQPPPYESGSTGWVVPVR